MHSPISLFCDIHKDTVMLPVEMPKTNNETLRLLKDVYKYNKPVLMSKKIFIASIHKGYVRFKCPKCNFEKLTQISELIIKGFIDANTCKSCDLDVCLWTKCTKGGYIKNE